MAAQQKPIRAFEPVKAIDIYRVIGRRPSNVWVDSAQKIVASGPENQPLKELVYWHTKTKPGEEIQERIGGMFLVTANGECHPIVLCPPEPLQPETAFLHAQAVRQKDAARITELLEQGDIVEVVGRKPSHLPSRPGDRLVSSSHVLVTDERPPDMDQWGPPARFSSGTRRIGGR
jgi:hypothetical protein